MARQQPKPAATEGPEPEEATEGTYDPTACQAKTGTEEQQNPAGKDPGNVNPVDDDDE